MNKLSGRLFKLECERASKQFWLAPAIRKDLTDRAVKGDVAAIDALARYRRPLPVVITEQRLAAIAAGLRADQ